VVGPAEAAVVADAAVVGAVVGAELAPLPQAAARITAARATVPTRKVRSMVTRCFLHRPRSRAASVMLHMGGLGQGSAGAINDVSLPC